MKTTFKKDGKKTTIYECVTCHKITAKNELKYNAKFGAYNFAEICNRCSEEIDAQMDAQQQDRA